MKTWPALTLPLLVTALGLATAPPFAAAAATNLWSLAQPERGNHRFSTLFTAQNVREHLNSDAGIRDAIDWCQRTAVTKVYLEVFRNAYWAERSTLEKASRAFRDADIEVSGCVTTTDVGKKSNRWRIIACYTDLATQTNLQRIFEYAASLFDEVMIDDFWFTDCTCPNCDQARLARTVTIGTKTTPAPSDNWEDYRCELMVRLSRERVLEPARRVNPKVKLIIKYPQWYDQFHERGYEVLRQTADFDRTWVGTETRDYTDARWGGTVQYEAFFIMRWLGGLGGAKCGGGWFDPYGTTERTYLEQARQTVLGGARESMLFCYGSLLRDTGPRNVAALRGEIPELWSVARQVGKRDLIGIAAWKPANSAPENEKRIFDFVGMLGLPLAPCHDFPTNAPAAFFSIHALKDPGFAAKLRQFVASGRPVLLTDGLAAKLGIDFDSANVHILKVKGDPKSLLALARSDLDLLREPMLAPFKTRLRAPNKVALCLFKDGSWVVENFNDEPASVELNAARLSVPARGWTYEWR